MDRVRAKTERATPLVLAFHSMQDRMPIAPEEVVIADDFANDAIIAPADPAEWGLTIEDCREDAILARHADGAPRAAVG